MKEIHLTFGMAASGTIKYLLPLERKSDVIALEDNLSLGPIYQLDQLSGQRRRHRWWSRVRRSLPLLMNQDDSRKLNDLAAIGRYGCRWVVWAGSSAHEELGLCRLLTVLPSRSQVERVTLPDGRWFASVPPAVAAKALKKKTLLTAAMREIGRDKWKNAVRTQGEIRIRWTDGTMMATSEDYFDRGLLQICSLVRSFQPAGHVIGAMISAHREYMSDEFLHWRLLKLIERGFLRARGNKNKIHRLFVQYRTEKTDF